MFYILLLVLILFIVFLFLVVTKKRKIEKCSPYTKYKRYLLNSIEESINT